MKIEFNNGKKKTTGVRRSRIEKGDYQDIVEHREKLMPKIEKEVQEVLRNYHGQGLALIMVEEDENGEVTGIRQLISGVGTPTSQLRLAKTLMESGEEVVNLLMESIKNNPEVARGIMREIAELLGEE